MSNYTEIFDSMIFTLSQFAQSDKPLGVKEIEYRLGVSRRKAQRVTKELSESGWLDFEKAGRSKLYFATDKAKQLFGEFKALKGDELKQAITDVESCQ